ncbi:Glucokinase [Alphaproteobacteria bacterium SO-S41]|nr:Glucokinase [Alphaproteobacteria bacterium SO-S41]
MTELTLLADAGGTFTRFALADGATIGPVRIVESGHYRSFIDAAREFLKDAGGKPSHAAIAAAGPLSHGEITLTNGPRWRIAPHDVATGLQLSSVRVVNDFAALAAAAPHLDPAGLTDIAPGTADPAGAIAVIGPGTGLGVALLAPLGEGRHRVLPGEGGHAGLSPTNDRESAILSRLVARFGHVKAEHVLSGLGLEILWETLAELDGVATTPKPSAGEIAERAEAGTCAIARETVAIFTGWLGGFAGDIALIAGASGGVYLAGGILPRWGTLFDTALFHRRFTAKGAHQALMEAIPVRLVTDPQVTFRGLLALGAGEAA